MDAASAPLDRNPMSISSIAFSFAAALCVSMPCPAQGSSASGDEGPPKPGAGSAPVGGGPAATSMLFTFFTPQEGGEDSDRPTPSQRRGLPPAFPSPPYP